MPYPVQNLIDGHAEPDCVKLKDPAQTALGLMIENDYSQLPVIDDNQRPIGLVTHESILRAIVNFDVCIDELLVSDALVKVTPFYHPEDDLFDLLDRLKDTNAVLIVDGEGRLKGIVTSYDSTEYFRRWAEDMMLVRDIESTIKDLIQQAFSREDGEIDLERLNAAIQEISPSNREVKQQFRKLLGHYLKLQGAENPAVNSKWLEESLSLLAPKEKPKGFDDLTLFEYTEMLLQKERWEFFRNKLEVKLRPDAVRKLLTEVRNTRNDLAHFRGEILPVQREQLKFCASWFSRHPLPNQVKRTGAQKHVETQVEGAGKGAIPLQAGANTPEQTAGAVQSTPREEQVEPQESRYALLAVYLQGQPGNIDRIQLTFNQVEEIVQTPLPASARQHRAWWANDTVSHSQSLQWLEAGWRVSYLNLSEETVTFIRIIEREKAYISFYSKLLTELRKIEGFPLKKSSPDGQSWIIAADLPTKGSWGTVFGFSFARNRRFRVELYIDSNDAKKNKQVFDSLHAKKAALEAEVGGEISWERLDERRAARIACYHAGTITDDPGELKELIAWAAGMMPRFYAALAQPVSEAMQNVA